MLVFLLYYFTQTLHHNCAYGVCVCIYLFVLFSLSPLRVHLSSKLKGSACERCIVVRFFIRSFFLSIFLSFFVHSLALRFYLAKRLLISCIKMGKDTISAETSQYDEYTQIHTSSHSCIMYI